MNNSEVRRKLLSPRVQYLEEPLEQNRLQWLDHVLCMSTERLPSYTTFFEGGNG